jgi:NhaP-type Na+/H+ or K+/H+ antiporter
MYLIALVVGKFVGRVFGIPPLIVVFFVGLAYGNIPSYNYLTGGISSETRRVVSRLGLANTLVRTGLAISGKVIARAKWNIILMSFLPLVTEIVVHGFVAGALFTDYKNGADSNDAYSPLWPFLQASVVAPTASGVVAAVVMLIQQRGYTITRGPGVLLIPSCALEMTLGVWCVIFLSSLIFRNPDDSLAWAIIQGPLQIIVGAFFGVVLGLIWYFFCLNVICKDIVHGNKMSSQQQKNNNDINSSSDHK